MGILDTIRIAKEVEVAELLPRQSEFQAAAEKASPPAGFRAALENSPHRPSLIAEVKKASPSRGIIRENFDPAEIAASYAEAGADCLSVLTDREFFQGHPDYLPLCRQVSGLPCLRKDFIIHPVQVYQARALGADAILLIMAMLDDETLSSLMELSAELGMDTLIEVHDLDEAKRVPEAANLVGINNRSLHTFAEDLGTTGDLASHLMKPGRTLVSESSLSSFDQVSQVSSQGARSVLIGTTFCSSENVSAKVREVMGW